MLTLLRTTSTLYTMANNKLCYRRKDFSDKAQEKLTPESQKSPLDKAKEGVTNAGDSVAGAVQPGMPHLGAVHMWTLESGD